MQKVVGSSPIIRSREPAGNGGFSLSGWRRKKPTRARWSGFGQVSGQREAERVRVSASTMEWDSDERYQIERAFEIVDRGSSVFERLVNAKDRLELLDELGKLKLVELRKILLARVLLEQLWRAHYGYVPFTPFQDS